MNHYGKKLMLRAVFAALVAACFTGCGNITPLAEDGGGGGAGRVALSTGGAGSNDGTGGAKATGGAPGTGGTVVSAGGNGDPPGTGGAGGIDPPGTGGSTGADAGATGGATVVTIDAGSSDSSGCPSKLRTSFGASGYATSLSGTSTGITMSAGTNQGGGPTGADPVVVLTASLVPDPNSTNPPAASTGSFEVPVSENCYGDSTTNDDLSLQGYTPSFWVSLQGACDVVTAGELGWRVGLVTGSGVTFPWSEQVGAVPTAACTSGVKVSWQAFAAGMKAHALVIQFVDSSPSVRFSGYVNVSDVSLTFN